ncbi:sigma-70 family RNA polymerase sigma factor [Paenibacillus sp. CC-CFT747]|nr:sigma-70 family RNA polymerase sigma factor [Paenibacillus sp. CC-CFT747]
MDEELHRLIGEARRGGKDAFARLVTLYKDRVYRHAYGMLGDRMEAEDMAQEAFLKAYYALPGLESEYAFSSWLMRIVTNLCKDRLLKRDKLRRVEGGPYEEAASEGKRDQETPLYIREALGRLSVEHREVILLHDLQGYRYEEIAVLLEIPVGTVKSRLHAARVSLRKEMRGGRRMKTHPEDQLTAYIDKELGEEERRAVENHLKDCPDCRSLVEELLDMQQQLVTSYSGVGAPRNIEWQVMQAIHGQGKLRRSAGKGLRCPSRGFWRFWLGLSRDLLG